MGLQLFVRHAADIVIVDLTGIATMGPANDSLNRQLRQLIDDGTDKILVNLTHVTQLDSSGIGINCASVYFPQASRCKSEIAATAWKCEAGSGDGAFVL